MKKMISTPLMIENPVRSPMVPPIADSMSTNLADLSFVILSNVGVSKNIRTYFRLFFHWLSIFEEKTYQCYVFFYHLTFDWDWKLFMCFVGVIIIQNVWDKFLWIFYSLTALWVACHKKSFTWLLASILFNWDTFHTFKMVRGANRMLEFNFTL